MRADAEKENRETRDRESSEPATKSKIIKDTPSRFKILRRND